MKNVPHNVYIHVPYCKSKCNYCAFFSHACAKPDWEKYCNDICAEINYWGQKLGNITIPTIFFGGGTPSLMPTTVFEKIINTIKNNFQLETDTEITVESNPATIDFDKLKDFKSIGANRISIGIQSLDDKRLQFLGRKHTANDALQLIEYTNKLNLRTSADFIYGLPNDTVQDIIKMCTDINSLGLTHCSLYELTIEKGTPFGTMNLKMPSNTEMADMYNAIEKNLNLPRYEVSNYAMSGFECKHNQNVWDGKPYIGIGQGAAGRVYINNIWYEQMGNYAQFEKISDSTRAIEQVITGMRTIHGCQLTDTIKNVIDMDWAISNPDLIKIENERIATTKKGMLILDEIIVNLVK
ncbi:MAG: radical SAM family heme chaperone HemW [Alphaproteobacteria bacterium]|nr:radical SAM family heme chaperone HemW [Alphaproteobacteria bacterium]